MNLRKTFLAAAILLAVALTSCGTARRAGKDLGIVAVCPVLIPYAGFTDGFATAKEVADGLETDTVSQVFVMPFTIAFGLVKHTVLVTLHALDFCFFPVYGAAELHPYGPEIQPLDYYTGTPFDEPETKAGTDAETGEAGDR